MPANFDLTPSANAIKQLGGYIESAVESANKMVDALNGASVQLSTASENVRKNSPAIASSATNLVQANASSMAPVIGSANAAMLNNLPSPLVKAYMRKAVDGGAKAIKKLSVTAKNTAKAIQHGLKKVQAGAAWFEANVSKAPLATINNAVNEHATNAVNIGASSINSAVKTNLPSVNLKANLNASHTNAAKQVAGRVKAIAGRKTRKIARK